MATFPSDHGRHKQLTRKGPLIPSGMSQEEISEALEEIKSVITPGNLERLCERLRAKGGGAKMDSPCPTSEGPDKRTVSFAAAQAVSERDSGAPEDGSEEGVLPIKPEPGWLHMDVVEKDKLEWMGNLPPPPKQGQDLKLRERQVRFGFDGDRIPLDEEVPTYVGLHHHGEQGQAAGYTLSELVILVRSSLPSQRILSLDILSNIASRYACFCCWSEVGVLGLLC